MGRKPAKSVPEARRVIRAYIAENGAALPEDDERFDEMVARFAEKNYRLTKESTRLMYVSTLLAALYWIVTYNLKLDAKFMDQRLFDLPYLNVATILFALLVHIALAVKAADAKIYDHYVREICLKRWGSAGDLAYRSYIGEGEVAFNIIDITNQRKDAKKLGVVYTAMSMVSSVFIGPLFLLPIISAAHFLYLYPLSRPWNGADIVSSVVAWLLVADVLAVILAFMLTDTSPPDELPGSAKK